MKKNYTTKVNCKITIKKNEKTVETTSIRTITVYRTVKVDKEHTFNKTGK